MGPAAAQARRQTIGVGKKENSMAFLVCYSSTPPEDHTKDRAIYLDRLFYQLIFIHCRLDLSAYTVLRNVYAGCAAIVRIAVARTHAPNLYRCLCGATW